MHIDRCHCANGDLYQPAGVSSTGFTDLLTGGNNSLRLVTCGNPDLTPEKARTVTVGMVLTPAFLPNLNLSIDYYDTEITGRFRSSLILAIGTASRPNLQTVLASASTERSYMYLPIRSPAVSIGLSIAIATGLYGVSFGALGVASGLSVWQTIALSVLMFTGGSQFAFIGVVAGGGAGPSAFSAAALLGVRNAIYGMQMNRLLRLSGWRRLIGAQITIDESAATAAGQFDRDEQRRGFWTAGVGIYVLWNLFTAIGAVLGDAMGDPRQWGLDGAAVAAFLGLLWPRLSNREPVAIAIVCALVTVLAIPLAPPGVPIIVAAVVAAAWGWFGRGPADKGLEPDVNPKKYGDASVKRAESGVLPEDRS